MLIKQVLLASSLAVLIALAGLLSTAVLPHLFGRRPPAPAGSVFLRDRPPGRRLYWIARRLLTLWPPLRRLLHAGFFLLLLALLGALSLTAAPRLFGYGTLVVQGGSMSGSIDNGSLVISGWLPAENVRLGDVILVQEERTNGSARPKIHRVISLQRDGGQVLVWTKGDANRRPDPHVYVLPERVQAPVRVLPYLGYLVGFVATPLGWALLVALPATALCTVTLRRIWWDQGRVRKPAIT